MDAKMSRDFSPPPSSENSTDYELFPLGQARALPPPPLLVRAKFEAGKEEKTRERAPPSPSSEINDGLIIGGSVSLPPLPPPLRRNSR